MGDAGDAKDIVHAAQVDRSGTAIGGLKVAIFEVGEEDFLIVLQLEVMEDIVLLHGFEVGRTLGDNDDIGAETSFLELTQVSIGEDVVVVVGVAVFGEQDVDAGFDGTMLEDIVEDDELGSLWRLYRFRIVRDC